MSNLDPMDADTNGLAEEPDGEILASGYWCTNCEYFEDGEDFVGIQCKACGCPMPEHIKAIIVED